MGRAQILRQPFAASPQAWLLATAHRGFAFSLYTSWCFLPCLLYVFTHCALQVLVPVSACPAGLHGRLTSDSQSCFLLVFACAACCASFAAASTLCQGV